MKVVVISDTHSRHRNLRIPLGDLVIHAGDISYRGEKMEVDDFMKWFRSLPHAHKILIAGNHDFYFEKTKPRQLEESLPPGIHYLNDSGVEIEGFKFWGSPVTPKFFNWAFNRRRGADIRKHWELVPPGTDVLITHGPPFGILDQTSLEQHVGCRDLLHTVRTIKPKVHVFGHIHEAYGTTKNLGIRFFNASMVNENYEVINKPIIFELQ